MSHTEIFTDIYEKKSWGDGSGGGSTPEATVEYRALLQKFLKEKEIKVVIDFGCGYFNGFMNLIDWTGIYYWGSDCVKSIIEKNRQHFPFKRNEEGFTDFYFIHSNHLPFAAPPDFEKRTLIIIKDVLQHWTNDDIMNFSKQWKKFRYVLITNDFHQRKDWQELKRNHRPLSAKFEPLKQFNPKILLRANKKETSLITNEYIFTKV